MLNIIGLAPDANYVIRIIQNTRLAPRPVGDHRRSNITGSNAIQINSVSNTNLIIGNQFQNSNRANCSTINRARSNFSWS